MIKKCLLGSAIAAIFPHYVSAQQPETILVDADKRGAVISPLLFSHNLEVTRRAVWSGLSAEMVSNRKFAAVDEDKTMPLRWEAINQGGTVVLDTKEGFAGKQSVRIEIPVVRKTCGIVQTRAMLKRETLIFAKDTHYRLRLWVKAAKDRTIQARLGTIDQPGIFLDQKFSVSDVDWQVLTADVVAKETTDNVRLEISSDQIGKFWIGAVSIMPADAFHGMRRDVIDRLKEIKPGCLRFPGGCYSDFYRWQDGLLPRDQRPPIGPVGLNFMLPDSDDVDNQELGTDEFMALCREVGCEAAITLRLSDTSPEDAAAWVEYCNGGLGTHWGGLRADYGNLERFGVKTWFVGNELYYFGRGGLKQASNAAVQTKLFAEAVKKADPCVNLIGCTDKNNAAWNKAMLDQAGSLLTDVSCHDYLLDSKPKDLEAIAKAPTAYLRDRLRKFHEQAGKSIVLDEWNTTWGQPGTIGMGIYTAGVLNLLCREGEYLGVPQAYFFQPLNEGAIKITPLTAELDVAGQVFAAFKGHQGNSALKIAPVAPEADIDTCASVSNDGGRLFVTIVNRTTTRDHVIHLKIDHFGTGAKGGVHFLSALQPTSEGTTLQERDESLQAGDGDFVLKLPRCGIAVISIHH